MAVLDLDERRLVVRIVYDGPASAGKTTNLKQLVRMFTPLRRSEMVTHGERAGRTLFFDWLQIEGGLVAGYPLRCQLITVPGQAVLGQRRREILASADAVVFVSESEELEHARRMLEGWRSTPTPPPLVLQANKQDRPGARAAEVVREALGLGAKVPAVAAVAPTGNGVKETLVLAIRAAADAVQQRIREHGVETILGKVSSDADLLSRLQGIDQAIDRETTRTSVVLDALVQRTELATATDAVAADGGQPTVGPDRSVCQWPIPGPTSVLVWPAVKGRELMEALAPVARGLTPCDLGDQRIGTVAGRIRLWTRGAPYQELDVARTQMLARARGWTRMADLLPERVALNIQELADGRLQLWELWPRLPTLDAWLRRARDEGDREFLAAGVGAWADGIRRIAAHVGRDGLAPDASAGNLSLNGGRVVWLGDEVAASMWPGAIMRDLERWSKELDTGTLRPAYEALAAAQAALRASRPPASGDADPGSKSSGPPPMSAARDRLS